MAIVTIRDDERGRFYRAPSSADIEAVLRVKLKLAQLSENPDTWRAVFPDEPLPPQGTLGFRVQLYGMLRWGDLFSPRQRLTLATLAKLVNKVGETLHQEADPEFSLAVQEVLSLGVGKMADYGSSLSTWMPQASQETVAHTFSRQALPMVWDFAEAYPFASSSGGWEHGLAFTLSPLEAEALSKLHPGVTQLGSATEHSLPDDSAWAVVTDPPYYDAVPYADLSDFFLVWLRRCLGSSRSPITAHQLSPKDQECVVHEAKGRGRAFFEATMECALREARRVTRPDGIGVVVFAHKSTTGWETQLQAMISAGWIVTGSWPIDTERGARLRAMDSAALASSIHLVCRPRDDSDQSNQDAQVGDWRDVLVELPKRIHEWMPRLQSEGVVGADAIFACLGPALEIFSRHSRVEKPNGDPVTLRDYLEYVWAAVSREAISMIFEGADTSGFEEDARLTAMWLWTLSPGLPNTNDSGEGEIDSGSEDNDDKPTKPPAKLTCFMLEYDAARKIAQGLGAHLELLVNLVEVKGETARLLPVAERTKALFGKEGTESPSAKRKKSAQLALPGLLEELEQEEGGWTLQTAAKPGSSALDRLHQAMILFAAGRGEALRRFLVDDGVGKDQKFWSLAQSLCALYPSGTDERRWSEGVLARKKGLGL